MVSHRLWDLSDKESPKQRMDEKLCVGVKSFHIYNQGVREHYPLLQ